MVEEGAQVLSDVHCGEVVGRGVGALGRDGWKREREREGEVT